MTLTLAFSLLLTVAGAILIWGVNASVGGVDLDLIGAIALFVGILGTALASLIYARDRGSVDRHRRRDYMVER